MARITYEVTHHALEDRWLVHRAGIPFSVHESQADALCAAREHARAEHDDEHRHTRVRWCSKSGEEQGSEEYL